MQNTSSKRMPLLASFFAVFLATTLPTAGFPQQLDSWQSDLSPIPSANWNYDTAAHLLERAGFGGTPAQIQTLAEMAPLKRLLTWYVSMHPPIAICRPSIILEYMIRDWSPSPQVDQRQQIWPGKPARHSA